ncbi:NADP-dependent oxidoreductase [Acidisoma sp. 7E03]
MSDVMKVVRLHAFGGPDRLVYEDAPKPRLGAGEVLVRVHAVGVNPPDWYLREGYAMLPPEWQPKVTFPIIPGTDISGVVEFVAPDVQGFAYGDAVYAMVRFPIGLAGESRAYAEYVAVPATELALKPVGIDHAHAAAAPMSLLTAWQFLIDLGHEEPNPLQPHPHVPVPLEGKTVLVNGAAGGVGHLLVQLAKWRGARVIAVASGSHEAFLRDLGADVFIDYRTTTAEDAVRDLDLVVDAVGGPETGRFLRTLKPGGALFPIFPLGFDDKGEAERRGITVSTTQVRSNGAQLTEIAPLLAQGTIRLAIDSRFALSDASKAHLRAASGHLRGKIVLTVGPEDAA